MAQEINFGTKFIRICPTDNNKIEHSSNGKSWSTSYKGSSYGCFYDLAVFGGEIFAITSKGVYASKNGGCSWSTRYIGSCRCLQHIPSYRWLSYIIYYKSY